MTRHRGLRFVALLVACVCLALAFAIPAHAEESSAAPETTSAAATPDGVYAVVGSTSTGRQVSANVLVTTIGDRVQFQARVLGIPITTSGTGQWNAERTEVTVPVSVWILGIADGNGTITLIAKTGGWEFFGTGNGEALGKSGSATATGFKPGGGTEPEPALVEDATGVSESAQSIDDGTGPLQPADPQPQIDTGDVLGELAAILFAVFFVILLEMILGVVFL